MIQARHNDIVVRALSQRSRQGWLEIATLRLRCTLGRNGRGVLKREGDGLSPIGRWPIVNIFFRADKRRPLRMPSSIKLYPKRPIRPADGWCDQPADTNYNRYVKHPYPASAEHLWRGDELYDIIVVLGHNHCPRVKGGGSAIFMHIAMEDDAKTLQPTAGCIALRARDLKSVIARCRRTTHVCIMA